MDSMHSNGCRTTLIAFVLALLWLAAACTPKPTLTPTLIPWPFEVTPTATDESTPEPAPTATQELLGSPGNPVVIGFLVGTPSSALSTSFDQIAVELTDATGYSFTSQVFPSYDEMLTAFDEGRLHVAWLPPVTYLVARDQGLVDVLLVSNHFGRYAYGTQFLAHVSSGFTPYFDPVSNQDTADAGAALAEFAGKRPCLTEPGSVSGYWLPLGLLASQSVPTLPAVITQSQNGVIRSLYIQQICDFGATFALSGDPRTASGVLQDMPDVLSKVVVIWRSEAVIPSFNVSVSVDLPNDIRQTLNDALISLVKTADGKALLTNAVGYDIEDLKSVNDDFYNMLRNYMQASGADIATLVGK